MKLQTSQLDFETIKSSIIEFFKSQSEFSDYNFEGSGLAVLIDLLAYNTHYNALYTNMAVNESFLDSASIRDSVVSLAKGLGYTPRSTTCSRAIVDVKVNSPTSSPSGISLAANTPFTTILDEVQYTFYTVNESMAVQSTGYLFNNVELIEGEPLTFSFIVSSGVKYILPNTSVDTGTIRVREQDDSSSKVYTQANSIVDVKSDSRVFYLKEVQGGLVELYFGENVVGKQPTNGSKLIVDYFVSSGSLSNFAKSFSYAGPPLIGGVVTTTTKQPSFGGAEQESTEQIRQNAPRFRAAQGRAVTIEDYKSIILDMVPEASSVTAFGGEDMVPPVYGKVFICIKPNGSDKLTDSRKLDIVTNILKKRNIVSVTPEILDIDYIYIDLDILAVYNQRETVRGANELSNIIRNAVLKYGEDNLDSFDGVLRQSNLLGVIDKVERSIINSSLTLSLRKRVSPKYGVNSAYSINLINPIYSDPQGGNIKSTGFYLSGKTEIYYLEDNGVGQLRVVSYKSEGVKVIDSIVGSVNYSKGLIQFSLNIGSIVGQYFELKIIPYSYDVVSAMTQICVIDNSNLNITVVQDSSNVGDLRAGFNYIFPPARNE